MAKFIRDRIEAFVSRGYDRMAIDAGWTEQETYGCLIGYVNKYGLCDYTWGGELIVINSRVATINYENGTARIVSRALLLSMPAPHLEPPASPRNDYPRWLWRP
jgi:hypothetical protein